MLVYRYNGRQVGTPALISWEGKAACFILAGLSLPNRLGFLEDRGFRAFLYRQPWDHLRVSIDGYRWGWGYSPGGILTPRFKGSFSAIRAIPLPCVPGVAWQVRWDGHGLVHTSIGRSLGKL